jgi:hypothetical protein
VSRDWVGEARVRLWLAVWRAIGEAHWFLARNPGVYPSDASVLFHAGVTLEIYEASVRESEDHARRMTRAA